MHVHVHWYYNYVQCSIYKHPPHSPRYRVRLKALQAVIDQQSSRLATLSAEREAAALCHQDQSTGQGRPHSSPLPPCCSWIQGMGSSEWSGVFVLKNGVCLVERASQEEQNGANFSFLAPSSEEL